MNKISIKRVNRHSNRIKFLLSSSLADCLMQLRLNNLLYLNLGSMVVCQSLGILLYFRGNKLYRVDEKIHLA
ncbi:MULTISPECIES: hypothetical protein [unclassified Acinetobacter]|uniref:hypothetical protein n=1 Tax=unclassified Acinetobacter TaxID=196816 RepID=UPI0035B8549B